jgi:endoglucanase
MLAMPPIRVSSQLARSLITVVLLMLAAAFGGCGGRGTSDSPARTAPTKKAASTALTGRSFWVDPGSAAARQAAEWQRLGRTQDSQAMTELARQPTAYWITDDVQVYARVRSVVVAAARAGKSPLFVAYYIPGRDCGQYSAGGASDAVAYRTWLSLFATAIGRHAATVVVEPDAVAQAVSGCVPEDQLAERYQLLRSAVHAFSALPNTAVYLDAGNEGWIKPVDKLVSPLRQSGIGGADGFALNVSNFYGTDTTIRYGNELSRALSGAHFVIDTSRNGNGPYTKSNGSPNWCNPPGRAIGAPPTTNTGRELVDAYLWIKPPGESDGACRPGAPAAGVWWPDYALSLVRNRER